MKLFKGKQYKLSERAIELLSIKFLTGHSTNEDLQKWEQHLSALKNSNKIPSGFLKHMDMDIFTEYLLLHHPDHESLKKRFNNDANIQAARSGLYRNAILDCLAQSYQIIEAPKMKKRFSNKKISLVYYPIETYLDRISQIEQYMSFYDQNKNIFTLTDLGKRATDTELLLLLKDIQQLVPERDSENWHKRVINIEHFKISS